MSEGSIVLGRKLVEICSTERFSTIHRRRIPNILTKKLDKMAYLVGYPDTWKDYGSVAIGAAQSAGRKSSELTGRSRTRLHIAVSAVNFLLDSMKYPLLIPAPL